MEDYVVVSNDPGAFFLGRYQSKEAALKAAGNDLQKWVIYQQVTSDGAFNFDRAELENQLVLTRAAYEGVSSLLLSVQQDCIKAKKEIALLKEEWQSIVTAPKTVEEIFELTGEWDYQIMVGRKATSQEDGSEIAGCAAEAEWRDDGWYSVVSPELRYIFGDYNKIVDPTHWRPRCKEPK